MIHVRRSPPEFVALLSGVIPMVEDRWLSVDEIALYLGVKRDTVYKWIDRKHMPAHKVGRLWKFRKDEVDQWIRNNGGTQQGDRNG